MATNTPSTFKEKVDALEQSVNLIDEQELDMDSATAPLHASADEIRNEAQNVMQDDVIDATQKKLSGLKAVLSDKADKALAGNNKLKLKELHDKVEAARLVLQNKLDKNNPNKPPATPGPSALPPEIAKLPQIAGVMDPQNEPNVHVAVKALRTAMRVAAWPVTQVLRGVSSVMRLYASINPAAALTVKPLIDNIDGMWQKLAGKDIVKSMIATDVPKKLGINNLVIGNTPEDNLIIADLREDHRKFVEQKVEALKQAGTTTPECIQGIQNDPSNSFELFLLEKVKTYCDKTGITADPSKTYMTSLKAIRLLDARPVEVPPRTTDNYGGAMGMLDSLFNRKSASDAAAEKKAAEEAEKKKDKADGSLLLDKNLDPKTKLEGKKIAFMGTDGKKHVFTGEMKDKDVLFTVGANTYALSLEYTNKNGVKEREGIEGLTGMLPGTSGIRLDISYGIVTLKMDIDGDNLTKIMQTLENPAAGDKSVEVNLSMRDLQDKAFGTGMLAAKPRLDHKQVQKDGTWKVTLLCKKV